MVESLHSKFIPRSLSSGTLEEVRTLGAASTPITYPNLMEIEGRLNALKVSYPGLVELWTSKERYGVDSGPCGPAKCLQTFIKITNFTSGAESWATQSPTIQERPQIFLSGNLHGDEIVGPVTLMTLAEMLLASLDPRGKDFNPWIARLVNTRTIVMVVVSNPYGFYANQRWDYAPSQKNDPNRDFAYSLPAGSECLHTPTAQGINFVWREHLFRLAVTFHGGMESITYEWGSMKHTAAQGGTTSPDDVAQTELSNIMGSIAGTYLSHDYTVGRTNDVVYPVEGGMEDWAYAGASYPPRTR